MYYKYIFNFKKMINIVLKENGTALKYLDDKYKNNKIIVTKAVKQDIRSLSYASKELLNNPDFIIGLAKKMKNEQIIYYADTKLLNDKQFNIDIINKIGFNLYFVYDKFKDDIDVVISAPMRFY